MNSFPYFSVSVPRFGVREESKAFQPLLNEQPASPWTVTNSDQNGLLRCPDWPSFWAPGGYCGLPVLLLFFTSKVGHIFFFFLNKSNMFICTLEESDSERRTVKVICNVNTLTSCRWLKRLDIVKVHLATPGAAAQLFPLKKDFLFPPHPPELAACPRILHVQGALPSAWVTESPLLLLAPTFPKPKLNWRISDFIAESRLKVFSPGTNPQFKTSN